MKLKDLPAAHQASLLYHHRMRVVFEVKRVLLHNEDARNVVRIYLSAIDTKLAHLRTQLHFGAPRQSKKRR